MPAEPVIRLRNVAKQYPMGNTQVQALRQINLDVEHGCLLVVMGPSGSGKSTLMNIIGLLDRPDQGEYLLGGSEVGNLDDTARSSVRNRTIGFIFQTFNLLPRATALRNVMLPLAYRSMPEAERRRMAESALQSVGLHHRRGHLPTQLSGGERQRVAIARALVGEPSVILADEPTGNLDSKTGQEIVEILVKLAHEGQTVIMVSHDVRLVQFADRVINIIDGEIQP